MFYQRGGVQIKEGGVDGSRKIKNLRFFLFFVDPRKKMKSEISVFSGLIGF